MATTHSESDSRIGEFTVNTQLHGHADGPDHVHVEINPAAGGMCMAIVAAGVDGRYSFDFRLSARGIEIEKAYVEGMREQVADLPDWMDCVREQVAEEMAR